MGWPLVWGLKGGGGEVGFGVERVRGQARAVVHFGNSIIEN